jgi:aspartyl-tRNA synthetase
MQRVFQLAGVEVATPFPRLTYREALERFGVDRPDTRFGLELQDLTGFFRESAFSVFRNIVDAGGQVRGIVIPGAARWSRKQLDGLQEQARAAGAGGLAWIKPEEGKWKASLPGAVTEAERETMFRAAGGSDGDLLAIVAGAPRVVREALGTLRLQMGRQEGLIDDRAFQFVWVVDFPMFEYDEEAKRFVACHHPFTSPQDPEYPDPAAALAKAYDLVLNGTEIGGGSIRIHRDAVQQRVFRTLGMSPEEAREKFGFLLDALRFGAPPHGGIALGLDRLVMILAGEKSIREVIPFPKTTSAMCLMTGSPSAVAPAQLRELGLGVREGSDGN